MTYSIKLSNGTPLPIVNEAVKDDTSTSISLVGKNYANYGIVLNENIVHVLENFSNNTAPQNPLQGQLWWNSTDKVLHVYTGNRWKSMVSTTVGSTQPPSPATGDQWFNTARGQLNIWDGAAWINLGPQSSDLTGLNGAIAESILDTANPPQYHIVVKIYLESQVVAIYSKDATFTPAVAIPGFTAVAPGVTLASTYATAELNNSLVTKQQLAAAIAGISGADDFLALAIALG